MKILITHHTVTFSGIFTVIVVSINRIIATDETVKAKASKVKTFGAMLIGIRVTKKFHHVYMASSKYVYELDLYL